MFEVRNQQEIDKQILGSILAQKEEKASKLKLENEKLLKIFEETKDLKSKARSKAIQKKIEKLERKSKQVEIAVNKSLAPITQTEESESISINGELKLNKEFWEKLLDHQKAALEWLWEIHKKNAGGVLGDEMGLGKTIEIISLLESLRLTSLIEGPTLILAPATIIHQWKNEFSTWAPNFQVYLYESQRSKILKEIFNNCGVLITTYEILHTEGPALLKKKWFYVILDEGHKIKNPNAAVTQIIKKIMSSHRLLLTGTPIQNSLHELWSIFDFAFPGLLGSLEVFDREIATPINKAGYSNSDHLQVELGYQCALQLREIISPYFLRRTKKEIDIGIPEQEEKLLFCELTIDQWEIYINYIEKFWNSVTEFNKGVTFRCIKDLRLICNHPDLLKNSVIKAIGEEKNYTSGKLEVMKQLIEIWGEEGHSIVIFSQFKKMLNISEEVLRNEGIKFGRIDGNINIDDRLPIIQKFNSGEITALLMTTKVGGFGINLPKASRVLILDPDWNPMNDSQAKERALRIGQSNKVLIYRFITKHTIEEKIYNRQVFKTFLANKILLCPDQRSFFKNNELRELFSIPPKPEDLNTVESCPLPQKRKRENVILKSLLDSEGIKNYNEQKAIGGVDCAGYREINRMKTHAYEYYLFRLAQIAKNNLINSIRNNQNIDNRRLFEIQYRDIKIGNGKARDIIAKKRKAIVKDTTEKPRVEESIVNDLHEFFIQKGGKAQSNEIIEHISKELCPFDNMLVKEVLHQLSKRKNGFWVLRNEFVAQ